MHRLGLGVQQVALWLPTGRRRDLNDVHVKFTAMACEGDQGQEVIDRLLRC